MTQRVKISCCPQPEGVLERRGAGAGFAPRPAPEDAGASQRRRMAVLTAVCLLALAAGALLELVSGVPRVAPLAFFVLAYLSGGYYSTRNAIAALRERTVDVNLLMVTAAGGAATIDYWQEGGGLVWRSGVGESPITGESIPVGKGPGDGVYAGSLNQQGVLEIRMSRPASESTLARVIRLVEEAQSQKAEAQHLTEWIGRYYTAVVLGGASLFILIPPLFLGWPFVLTFYRAMTLLVVASPCALVISIPAAVLSAIAGGARDGILFKGGITLEQAAAVRVVALDKTGTLTEGKP